MVQTYETSDTTIYHFDLYRLANPEELEFLGVRDYFDGENLCLIEWPAKGRGVLPTADLTITIGAEGEGRRLTLVGQTTHGELTCRRIQQMRSEDLKVRQLLCDKILVTQYGEGYRHTRAFANRFQKALRKADIRSRSPYNVRHGCACRMLEAGMKPGYCSKVLGHTTRMFFETYANGSTEMKRSFRSKFGLP